MSLVLGTTVNMILMGPQRIVRMTMLLLMDLSGVAARNEDTKRAVRPQETNLWKKAGRDQDIEKQ